MQTPFELFLQNELDVEQQTFTNDWLADWHKINTQNASTDVDDFRGGRIRLGGVLFDGQPQMIYWDAFDRYLKIQIHNTFKKWDEETLTYSPEKRRASLDATSGLLESFTGQLVARATETDRRLRGRGFPQDVPEYNSSGSITAARAEILRLSQSFLSQLDDPPPTLKSSLIFEFSDQISGEAKSAEHRLSERLKQIESKHAANGILISGATIKAYTSEILETVSGFLTYMETELQAFASATDLDTAKAISVMTPALDRLEHILRSNPTFKKIAKATGGDTANKHLSAELTRIRPELERRIRRLHVGVSPSKRRPAIETQAMKQTHIKYDVFVSHASEDKDSIVRPFVTALRDRGLRVWYDETSLGWGASLRQEIDKGLARSRFGVVVISKHFFAKSWPQAELDGLFAKEMNGGERVLPIWHEISKEEVEAASPILAGKMARRSSDLTVDDLAAEVAYLCSPAAVSLHGAPESANAMRIDDGSAKGRAPTDASSYSDDKEKSVRKINFQDDIEADVISCQLAVHEITRGSGNIRIQWPDSTKGYCTNLSRLAKEAENHLDPQSIFHGCPNQALMQFLSSHEHVIGRANLIMMEANNRARHLVTGMTPYWPAEWDEFLAKTLKNFVTLCNVEIIFSVISRFRLECLYKEHFPLELENWFAKRNRFELFGSIFNISEEVVNAKIVEISGHEVTTNGLPGHYFWGPKSDVLESCNWVKPNPITWNWVDKYLIPQNELRLLENGSEQLFRYNETIRALKVLDINGNEIY